MNKIAIVAAAAILAGGVYYITQLQSSDTAASEPKQSDPMVSVALPETLSAEATMGKRAFDATCADCHGTNAAGKAGFGPPLVHKIYEPSHHGDMAFVLAVQQGARAHHWTFGDMPAQSGLTQADVKAITAYVRTLQRANGIN